MRVGPRLRSVAMIAVFDAGGPLITYSVLRSRGASAVTALVVSGVFPALGVIIGIVAHRRADAIALLVLAGIAVGAVLGLTTHNARLVLIEGSVPTGVFGLACLGSLWARRPLMFRFALEVSKVMPLVVTACLAAWTVAYSLYQKRKGERLAAAARRRRIPRRH